MGQASSPRSEKMKSNFKNEVLVIDNFFDERHLKEIHLDLNNLTSRGEFGKGFISKKSFDYLKKKEPDQRQALAKTFSQYHPFEPIYFNVILNKKHFAVKFVENFFKKKYGIKINDMESHYWLSGSNPPHSPHKDGGKINCMVHLRGRNSLFNGTGFYDKVDDKDALSSMFGFKENRAVIFDGDVHLHSSLQPLAKDSSARYIMTNFVDKDSHSL